MTTTEALGITISNSQTPPQPIQPPKIEPETKVTQPPVIPSQPPTTKTIPIKKAVTKRRRQPIVPIVAALIIAIAIGTWLSLSRPLPQFLARIVEPESENLDSEVPQEISTPTGETAADTAEPETTTEIDIPTELVAPGKSKTVALKPIQIEIDLTPEQNLIAVIKDKVAVLSQQYPQEVVSSVEANFRDGSLLVTIKRSLV